MSSDHKQVAPPPRGVNSAAGTREESQVDLGGMKGTLC